MPLFRKRVVHREDVPLLELRDVSVRYDSRLALEGISFQLEVGERLAVVGPNGAGKSTLFKVIAGVLDPGSGAVTVAGHCPGGHICIAYVPQRSNVDWSFPVTVADVVMMGRFGQLGLLRRPGTRDRELVRQCLGVVRMVDLADRQISELSGGQQQRMFIARSLAQEAELMLMDEPLAGLDVPAQEEIFNVLDELRRRRVTVMVATHDLNMAAERFDRVMLLNGRLIGLGRPEEVFTPDHLQEAYGGQLRLVQTEEGLMVLSDTCCGGGL
ncbi:MAG: metal ABC transporter ATP-binding protein [Chloroflexia bacterium]|nr:metal ABC transporter ATP-binding protein [Chloroflexia bacterium]